MCIASPLNELEMVGKVTLETVLPGCSEIVAANTRTVCSRLPITPPSPCPVDSLMYGVAAIVVSRPLIYQIN
jgi:hypothetical protein